MPCLVRGTARHTLTLSLRHVALLNCQPRKFVAQPPKSELPKACNWWALWLNWVNKTKAE